MVTVVPDDDPDEMVEGTRHAWAARRNKPNAYTLAPIEYGANDRARIGRLSAQ
jgi:hypothetical protein